MSDTVVDASVEKTTKGLKSAKEKDVVEETENGKDKPANGKAENDENEEQEGENEVDEEEVDDDDDEEMKRRRKMMMRVKAREQLKMMKMKNMLSQRSRKLMTTMIRARAVPCQKIILIYDPSPPPPNMLNIWSLKLCPSHSYTQGPVAPSSVRTGDSVLDAIYNVLGATQHFFFQNADLTLHTRVNPYTARADYIISSSLGS